MQVPLRLSPALYAACLIPFVCSSLSGCNSQSEASPSPSILSVSTTPAAMQPISRELQVAAVFQPFQEVDLHGKVSGYIRRINVDIGDRVHQGQVLATLEVPELQAQVLGADAGVARSQSDIARLKNEIARAEANYAASHANYQRLKAAADQQPGLIAAQELDDAEAHDLAAAAQVDAAKSATKAGEEALGISKADLQRVHTMAGYASITAPFNGVVTMRYADTGSLIPAGTSNSANVQPVVRLAQSDLLRLRLPIPEEEVPLVKEGSEVRVRVPATGQTFTGKVVRYTRNVSDTTRTMLTEVDVKNPDLSLTPGMYANASFQLQHKDNALVIPAAAVLHGDHTIVWVVDQTGHAQSRTVTLGIASANAQEITAGLNPGDQVIVGGQSALQAGQAVHAVPAHMDLVDYKNQAEGGR